MVLLETMVYKLIIDTLKYLIWLIHNQRKCENELF